MNSSKPLPVILCLLAGFVGSFLVGCGGSSNVSLSHSAPTVPVALTIQPGQMTIDSAGTPPLAVATTGPIVFGSTSLTGEFALLVGAHQFRPGTGRSETTVIGANRDVAILHVAGESQIWPYRTLDAPFKSGDGRLAAVAQDSNLFLEEVANRSGKVVGLNLLSFSGNSAVHHPYFLGDIAAGRHLRGVGLDGRGNALVEITSAATSREVRRVHSGTFDRRLKALSAYMKGLSTGRSDSNWYLAPRFGKPIPLQCPPHALGILVSAIRTPGRAVGAVIIGKGSDVRSIPCWWDLRGQIHELPLPNDVNFGLATDSSADGAVVGMVGNEITSYAALWPNVRSEAKNVNGMLPTDADFELRCIDSIGSDYTMVALAQPKLNSDQSVMVGLSPR